MWFDIPAPAPDHQAPPVAASALSANLYYGGPDQPPRALRDLLRARIEAAPPGSEIVWVTYYFRDTELADALVTAQKRGVQVRVMVEGRPRLAHANDEVIGILRAGLGENLRLHKAWLPGLHLHAKIYAFSGPRPEAMIGSFNPSGDLDEDDNKIIADIGDQDRGQNLLVGFTDPEVAHALESQALRTWAGRGFGRFGRHDNRAVRLTHATLYYYPRLRPDVVERSIADLGPGDTLQAAVSHMGRSEFTENLARAAERGAKVELVVHDTRRRVPDDVVADLGKAGVRVQRYCTADSLPMHAKFVVVQRHGRRLAWFGSLNYNLTSRYLNQEILARSTDAQLIDDLTARFKVISDQAARQPPGCEPKTRTVDEPPRAKTVAAATTAVAP